MKKILCIFIFLAFCNSSYSQKSCFDTAMAYRYQYMNRTPIEFDSLLYYLKKGQEMIVGCTFPNDTFTTVTNKRLALDSFPGKILVINFWSIYCPPCVNEIPSFHKLKETYPDVEVLAFTLDSRKDITQYLSKHQFNAQIIADARDFKKNYSLDNGYPFTILVGKDRKILFAKSGGLATPEHQMDLFDELSPVIEKNLKNK